MKLFTIKFYTSFNDAINNRGLTYNQTFIKHNKYYYLSEMYSDKNSVLHGSYKKYSNDFELEYNLKYKNGLLNGHCINVEKNITNMYDEILNTNYIDVTKSVYEDNTIKYVYIIKKKYKNLIKHNITHNIYKNNILTKSWKTQKTYISTNM